MKWVLILIQLFALSLLFPSKALASSVVLNELLPHPSSGEDWIELYNPTASAIDLSNWTLVDSTSTVKTLTGTISADGFAVFEVFNRLNNAGDTIYLKDSSGATIDQYSYSSDPGIDKSYGRTPDGGTWTTLSSSTKGTPNESVIITPIPSPSPSPSPTPSPSPSPSPTPNPSLTISNVPSSIKVDQEFSVNISIVNFQPNSTYYLKGAFKLAGGANYFGLTKVGSYWVKNKEHYSDQDPITTDPSGNWNGNLNVKGNPSDAGFIGAGNYTFKVGYYFNSSSVSWSNEINIFLDNPAGTTATSMPQPKPSPSPKSGNLTNTQAFITTDRTGPKPNLTPIILGTISASALPPTPSTETPKVQVAGSTLANIFMIGGGLIIILIAVLTFTFLKNGHFYNPFTKRNF